MSILEWLGQLAFYICLTFKFLMQINNENTPTNTSSITSSSSLFRTIQKFTVARQK